MYTSSRILRSLFKIAWLCWMYQLSNMQHVVVCWWWSSTSDWLRYTACPVLNTCSAKANAWMSPFFSARWCSLTRCLRLLPVWPMYTFEHSTKGMEYTTPCACLQGLGPSDVPASEIEMSTDSLPRLYISSSWILSVRNVVDSFT